MIKEQIILSISYNEFTFIGFLIFFAIGVISVVFFLLLAFFGKRKKKENFIKMREEIKEGYRGLQRASQTFHRIHKVLDDINELKEYG